MQKIEDLNSKLKSVFGFNELRDAQKPIVESIMNGEDVLAILKTSGGKSLCFQLPAVYRGGLTLVISPLISLMKDQVDALNEKNIPAAFVNSNLSAEETQDRYRNLATGVYTLFYVAPERFQDKNFLNALASSGLHTIAIDEAHCASQWGHDFRPHYSKIGASIESIEDKMGKRFQRIAFTATATDKVQEDICNILRLKDPVIHQQGFDRENLTYAVIPSAKNRDQDIEGYIAEHPGDSIIIYCTTVKRVEALYQYLKSSGIDVGRYHGKLTPEQKDKTQEEFINDKIRILISTSAFGMGVDKPNIRLVIHAQMPGSLEAWYQEAGRAGRDGLPAKAVLFYDPKDRNIHRFFIEMGSPSSEMMSAIRPIIYNQLVGGPAEIDVGWISKITRAKIQPMQLSSALRVMVGQGELTSYDGNVYSLNEWNTEANYDWIDEVRRNSWQKVNSMQQWCETVLCRRWTVLKYFGEKKSHERCGSCDTCQAEALSKSKSGSSAPYVRPITLMNFAKSVSSIEGPWKEILLGTASRSSIRPSDEPWYGRFTYYALGDLERWVQRLIQNGLMNEDFSLTDKGEKWSDGHILDEKTEKSLVAMPSEPVKAACEIPIDILNKWRKILAYSEDSSEMTIATGALLKKLQGIGDFTEDALISGGIPRQWVEKYGENLRAYVEKNTLKNEVSFDM